MKAIQQRLLATVFCVLMLAWPGNTRAADAFISYFDFWLYLDDGTDHGTAWRQSSFDDGAWMIGISEFGFGDGDEFTPINSSINTAYFRTYFNVAAGAYSNLTLHLRRDDGAVVYINGVEVFRNNMPTGAVSYATQASWNIEGADEAFIAQRVVPASILVNGDNSLAVEVHQAASGFSDMSFAMEVIGHRVGENQPPSANSSFITIEQDRPTAFVLDALDPDGTPLTYTIVSLPVHGSLSGVAPNLVYTPATGYLGPDLFSFKATDGQWQTEIAEVGIDVVPPSNEPPTADVQHLSVAEDSISTIILTASDPDGDALSYSFTQPAHGTLASAPGHSVIYQPDANYFGSDNFTFTVDDGNGGSSTAAVNIDVTLVNDAPVALAYAAPNSDPTNFTRNLTIVTKRKHTRVLLDGSHSSDVEGGNLSYAWYRDDETVPFSTEVSPTVSFSAGNYVLTLVVSDGESTASDSIALQVLKKLSPAAPLNNKKTR